MNRFVAFVGGLVLLCMAMVTCAEEAAPSMSKADWRQDLDTLYSSMQSLDPGLHHRTAAAEMDAYVRHLRKSISNASWPDYVMGLYKLLALVGDGHTTFYPMPDPGPGFDTRYPLLIECFADGAYVTGADAAYADAVGGKLVAVGGQPMSSVFHTMTDYWPHENEAWVRRWLPVFLRRPGFLHGSHIVSGAVDDAATFSVEKNGRRADFSVRPVSADADGAAQPKWNRARDGAKVAAPTPLHGKDVPFDFVYLQAPRVVYAVYNQVDDADKETVATFATRLFAFVDANPVDKLIIDIRENGGGDNYKNQPLLLGIIRARAIDRPGHLFVLIGPRTFSAAQNFASQAERWTQALFVGEPSGSSPNLWGDARQMELPHTHLHPMIATLYWQDSDPRDTRQTILPDLPAEASFADYLAGRDTAFDAALAYRVDESAAAAPPNTHWQRASQKAQWKTVW